MWFHKIAFVVNNPNFFISHRMNIAKKLTEKGITVDVYHGIHKNFIKNNDHNINYFSLPFDRENINIISIIKLLVNSIKLSIFSKYDIYHLVTIIPIIICGLPLRLQNKRTVFAISGFGSVYSIQSNFYNTIQKIVEYIYMYLFRGQNSRVIVQNSFDYEYLINNLKIPSKNVFLIKGSGVCKKSFPFIKEEPHLKKPTILMTARLIKEKGILELINASQMLIEDKIEHKLIIAGAIDLGNPNSLTEEEVDFYSNKYPQIKFLGHIDDIRPLLKECHIFCFPSYYREGLPKSLLEAAASGRAIITTNSAGCNEVVIHKETGLLVASKSVIELYQSLKLLIHDSKLRNDLRIHAYNKFLLEFEETLIVDKIFEVYKSFVKN